MESIIRDQIVKHLAENSLIFQSQHGFMARRSCLTNLLEYMVRLSDLVNQGREARTSAWLPVTSGVPQGSVLGPTLFVVYINPIDLVLENLTGFLSKFADDTKVGSKVDNEEDCEVMQVILNYLTDWADKWQLLRGEAG